MFLNLNIFGWDLEMKFRKKKCPTPKVILVNEDHVDHKTVSDIARHLF